jgi:hypothetical protein
MKPLKAEYEVQLYDELENRLKIKPGSYRAHVLDALIPDTLHTCDAYYLNVKGNIDQRSMGKQIKMLMLDKYDHEPRREYKTGFIFGFIAQILLSAMIRKAVTLILDWYNRRR